jgi:hypothetical protein
MKNFLIQRITENDDYTETPSDLPVNYTGGLPLPEFLDFLKQLGYHIESCYNESLYWAEKVVPTKLQNRTTKYLYNRIIVTILLNNSDKPYQEIKSIHIGLKFDTDFHNTYKEFETVGILNKNNQTIIPESLITLFIDIERELPNIENANTLDQLETAANDLILIIQEYNKQNQAPN